MNRIEKMFARMGKQQERYLVKDIVDGRTTILMINRQFGLIHKLNPVRTKIQEVHLGYQAWEFFDASIVSLTRRTP